MASNSSTATPLQEAWVNESRLRFVIIEGVNDVLQLDELEVATVGPGSNKVTIEQVEKLTCFARQLTNSRILLMLDCDKEGETGFKNLTPEHNSKSASDRRLRPAQTLNQSR